MRIRWFMSLSAPVALSILLSGCLVSKAPLITPANSDRLPLSPHLILTHGVGDKAALDLADDNSYVISSVPVDGKNVDPFEDRLYFKRISDDTYAYSRREVDKETGTVQRHVYGYLRILDSSTISNQEPSCSDFDPAEVRKLGVEIVEKNPDDDFSSSSCILPSVDVLETLLRKYLNDPKNAEKIKYGETQSAMTVTAK
jgi:hypothetical protein